MPRRLCPINFGFFEQGFFVADSLANLYRVFGEDTRVGMWLLLLGNTNDELKYFVEIFVFILPNCAFLMLLWWVLLGIGVLWNFASECGIY